MAAPAQVVTKCQLQCHNISLALAHHITKARNTAGPESHKPHYNSQMISRMLKAQTRSNQILSQKQMRQYDGFCVCMHYSTLYNTFIMHLKSTISDEYYSTN